MLTAVVTATFTTLVIAPSAGAQLLGPGTSFSIGAGNGPLNATVADINEDGDLDLITANVTSNTVAVLLGGAGGAFGTAVTFPAGTPQVAAPARAVAAADFNADGDLDLATANASGSVSVLAGEPGTAFGAPTVFSSGGGLRSIAAGDFDGDGDPDLVVASEQGDAVVVHRGVGGAAFATGPAIAVGDSPFSVAIADFDGDDDQDLAVANAGTDNVTVLRGGTATRFTAEGQFPAGDFPQAIATADFNRDGDPDLVTANDLSDDVSVLLGGPGATFGPQTRYPVGNGTLSVAAGDLDDDGDPEIVAASQNPPVQAAVLRGGPGGGFGAPIPFPLSSTPNAVALADFDADGASDVLTVHPGGNTVGVLLNTARAFVEVDTGRLEFPSQPLGTLSSPRTLNVFSSGDRALRVRDVFTGGAARHDFVVVGDGCSGRAVPVGSSCPITVRFAPEATGAREASLAFATNDPNTPAFAIRLQGTGGGLPAGAPGATGPAGPPGPGGPLGADRAPLVAAFASERHRGRRGKRLRIRYVVTVAADVTLELRRGGRVVSRASGTAVPGRNTIALRLPAKRGGYSLALTARAGSQTATDRASVTVAGSVS